MKVTCSACSFEREGPTEQPAGIASHPSEGDFWLCLKCGALHRFTGRYSIDANSYTINELFVRPADDAELDQLPLILRVSLLEKREEIRAARSP